MNTFTIDDATLAYDDTVLKSRHVLALKGTYYRFGIGGIPRGQSGRKVSQGPLIPGPWAYTFGLGSCISSNPEMSTGAEIQRNKAEGIEHTAEAGDRVIFDGVTYEVKVERGQYIELVQVERPDVDRARAKLFALIRQHPGLDAHGLKAHGWNPRSRYSLRDGERDGIIVFRDGGWYLPAGIK